MLSIGTETIIDIITNAGGVGLALLTMLALILIAKLGVGVAENHLTHIEQGIATLNQQLEKGVEALNDRLDRLIDVIEGRLPKS